MIFFKKMEMTLNTYFVWTHGDTDLIDVDAESNRDAAIEWSKRYQEDGTNIVIHVCEADTNSEPIAWEISKSINKCINVNRSQI